MMAAKKEGWRERESRKSQCTAMLLLLTVRKKKGMLIRVHISFLPLRRLMPYPCSHFYFDIKFGDRLYSKEKRRAWPLLF